MTSRIPPSRRDPQWAPQRAAKVVGQQTPGAGRVAGVSQAPVSEAVQAALRGRAAGGIGSGAGVRFMRERFPTSGEMTAAVTSVDLLYAPSAHSQHVYLNGLELDQGDDYTLATATVTFPAGVVGVDDVVEVRYAYGSAAAPLSVPFSDEGWKYLQVARTDAADYSATSFDDSAWATGTPPFGSDENGGHDFDLYGGYATAWALDTRLWVRRTLGPGITAATVRWRVDNSIAIWWNGQVVQAEFNDPAGGLGSPSAIAVPSSALGGNNVIAVRATDDAPTSGDKCVLDIQVEVS